MKGTLVAFKYKHFLHDNNKKFYDGTEIAIF